MMYLLDTNALSAIMKRSPSVRGRMDTVGLTEPVVTCAIVRGEIFFGLERMASGKRRDELASRADEVFDEVLCEPIPVRAADLYAQIKAAGELIGSVHDENDLWIAATARALGAVLVTRDRDFERIDGLTVENWET